MILDNYNITCHKGASFFKQFFWPVDKSPEDISHARLKIEDEESVIIDIDSSTYAITMDKYNGNLSLYLDAFTTFSLDTKTYLYDLQLVSNEGNSSTLVGGDFIVT